MQLRPLLPLCLFTSLAFAAPVSAEDTPAGWEPVIRIENESTMLLAAKEHFDGEGVEPADSLSVGRKVGPAITLRDAIVLSLENNPSLAVEKLGPFDASQTVLAAQGLLDTSLQAATSYTKRNDPSDSPFTGPKVSTGQFDFGLSLDQPLFTGGDVSIGWQNSRITSDSPLTFLSPEWLSGLNLSASQPLLRGTGWGTPLISIRINERLETAARHTYQAELANHIRRIIDAYWRVVEVKKVVESRQHSLELADRLKSDVEESVRVGLLAPLAASEADTEVALRKEELITAQNALVNAGRLLRRLIGIDFQFDGGASDFVPFETADSPAFMEVTFDEKESVRLALANRSELKAQEFSLAAADLSAKLARNQVLPSLNIQAQAGLAGLAGNERGAIQIPGVPPVSDGFGGGYRDALDTMAEGDYYNYSGGIVLQMPLENRAARARANQQEVALLREQYRYRALTQSVVADILKAISDIEAGKKRVRAGEEAVRYSNQSLDVARRKLNTGLGTIREVLEVQSDLSEAELRLARAETEYLIAIAEAHRSRGDLLQAYGIFIEEKQ